MSRVKFTALVLLGCLLLCSCGEQQNNSEVLLYHEKEGSEKEEKFKTTKVRKGVYEEKLSEVGELYYTDENAVTIDDENAYLDKICVKHKQKVKKGDVLAIYHIETSEASLNKKKLLVEQARTQYDSGLRSKRSEVLAKEKSIKSLTSKAEKRIAQIELKQMRNEYKQMVKAGDEIRKQEKEYAALLRKQKKTELKSRFSGTVIEPVGAGDFSDDEAVSGEMLMKIRNEDEFLISVKDDMGKLRYNMKVDIALGTTSEEIKHKLTGKVISTTNLTDGASGMEEEEPAGEEGGGSGSTQLIKVSKSDMKKYDFKKYNLFVTGVTLRIKNALLVDAEAVKAKTEQDEEKLYVYLVENNKLHLRYITSSYRQDKIYLVNQGLEEGQTLAIVD